MSKEQHKEAKRLLGIIKANLANDALLTYSEAASRLDRRPPQNYARVTAHTCNLLDAAACLAGVPLLALVKVREASGNVNPQAFEKEFGDRRQAIIDRSLNHEFLSTDFTAISNALRGLNERGDQTAWKYVEQLYPGDLFYRRLIGDYAAPIADAINDIGTDSPERVKSELYSYPRDSRVRNTVLLRAKGKCELCGELGFLKMDGTRYLESHHVIALAKDGEDRVTNVIALCPNDHREAHFGKQREELEVEMIRKLKTMKRLNYA